MTHPFEKSGLGKAPFSCTHVTENVFDNGDGTTKAGGCCDYCGTGIRWEFWIKGSVAGAKQFKVGCDCVFMGTSNGTRDDLILRVTVPVTTLCPCSKEISEYGAHNQRGYVTLEVRPKPKGAGCELILIEDLIEVAEKSGSAPVYALLKRTDERHVTMQAYDNPVFVEDLVRNAALSLKKDKRITSFEVKAENQESIHDHDAFAKITFTN
jgi:GTP cyclohydrolase I